MPSGGVLVLPVPCVALVVFLLVLPPAVSGGYYRRALGPGGPMSFGSETPGPVTLSTARCLAHCFTQFTINPSSDNNCQLKSTCKSCVHMCDLLHNHPATWRPACTLPSCNNGCQAACNHYNTRGSHQAPPKWMFPTQPSVTLTDTRTAIVRWHRPRHAHVIGTTMTSRHVRVVYVIVQREGGHWMPVKWTLTTHARLQVTPFEDWSNFRLLAVTAGGVVANVTLPEMDVAGDGQDDDSSGEVPMRLATHAPPKVAPMLPGVFGSLQARLHRTVSGHVNAVITWSHHLTTKNATYTITWSMTSCNVNTTFPHCPLTSMTRTVQIKAVMKKNVRITIKDLVLNADYVIGVGFKSHLSERIILITPPCHHPDATWRRCLKAPTHRRTHSPHHVMSLENMENMTALDTGMGVLLDTTMGGSSEGSQQQVSDESASQDNVTLTATMATLMGILFICIVIGAYDIYRRWNRNRHSLTLQALRYALWTPAAASQPRSVPNPVTPISFRPKAHSTQRLNPDTQPLQALSASPSLDQSHRGSAIAPEVPRDMWTRLSEGGVSDDLHHATFSPDIEQPSKHDLHFFGHQHSTPEHYLRSSPFGSVSRMRLAGSSASPIPPPSPTGGSEDDDVFTVVTRWASSDLEVDSCFGSHTLETFYGHRACSATPNTTPNTQRTWAPHITTNNLLPTSSQDYPLNSRERDSVGIDLDDIEQAIQSKCYADFRASLYLSPVASDCLTDDECGDDSVFDDSPRTYLDSTAEESYHFCSPGPKQTGELTPFLPDAMEEGITEWDKESESPDVQTRSLLVILYGSYDSYFV